LHERALVIILKALGEDHPDSAAIYNNLATNLDAQGKLTQAVKNWAAAAAIYERTRGARGASGLERSLIADSSPLPALATALPRAAHALAPPGPARGGLGRRGGRPCPRPARCPLGPPAPAPESRPAPPRGRSGRAAPATRRAYHSSGCQSQTHPGRGHPTRRV